MGIREIISPVYNRLKRALHGWPLSVQVSLSDPCNFHCTVCWVHGKDGRPNRVNLDASMFASVKPAMMGLDTYERLLNDLAVIRPSIYISFCGRGEPTLNPDFEEMIRLAGDKGIRSGLITNGSRLTIDVLKRLSGSNLSVYVSLNAHDVESHRAFSGVERDFFTGIIETIREYNSLKQRGVNIGLSFVIGDHNISRINDMAVLSSKALLPGSSIFFYPEWTHPGTKGHNVTKEHLKSFIDGLPAVKARLAESKISHNLDVLPYSLFAVSLSTDKEHPTRSYYRKNPCTIVRDFLVISADGRVFPCCNSAHEIGNINERDIRSIWRSEKAVDFRREAHDLPKHKDGMPLSNCFYCSHIQEYPFFSERYAREMEQTIK